MDELIKLQEQVSHLEKLAYYDDLTSLPNRRMLKKVFTNRFILRIGEQVKGGYLAILDIDNFKKYNDKLGHIAGDKLLVEFSKNLNKFLELNYTSVELYRLSGDEFILLINNITEHDEISLLFDRILINCQEDITFESRYEVINLTLSIGAINIKEHNDMKFEAILELADKQLYIIKKKSKNGYSFRNSYGDEYRNKKRLIKK